MNAPTLIVGLGGCGSKIVTRVARMAKDEKLDNISFVVFDTDVNELAGIKEKNPAIHTIQTSTNLSVGEYLHRDEHARTTWFPVNGILNSKMLTEGAGQVRSISRMAFETAIKAGKMEELHSAVEDLYKLEGNSFEQALRVIIVSSLAGGTGSGLLLPVALYIRHYLETRFRQCGNITRGFFLLPETFYGVIKGQAERNNLKSNAYAALRELDAFLMKGDNTLPPQYKNSVKMEFPVVGSNAYEEYDIRPYDFCFLFDAQNSDGKILESHEAYLDHAANCIYAQSIGPMNKRSNSSEDNTIRKLSAEKGRNRYAGAGSSILKYPVNDIQQYIALRWAKQTISDQWMIYDRQYAKTERDNQIARQNGEPVPATTLEENYVIDVNNDMINKKAFAIAIVNACSQFDAEGRRLTEPEFLAWNKYMGGLIAKAKDAGTKTLPPNLVSKRKDLLRKAENLKKGPKSGNDKEEKIQVDKVDKLVLDYKEFMDMYIEENKRYIAASIFRQEEDILAAEKLSFRLETYLRDQKGNFIHPNAVRYFLYNAQQTAEIYLAQAQKEMQTNLSTFEDFEESLKRDKEAGEGNEGKKKEEDVVNGLVNHQWSSTYSAKINNYEDVVEAIDNYKLYSIQEAIFKECLAYIKKLCESYKAFYASFSKKIALIDKQIRSLETKYEHTKGNAARYICASEKCLKSLCDSMPYMGTGMEINPELAGAIYKKIYDYSMVPNLPDSENYFSDIFDIDILNFYKGELMKQYGPAINMDIISAIQLEAEYEEGKYSATEKEAYVKEAFDEAKILSAPFIEKPLGEEAHPIPACTFNEALLDNDDAATARLVRTELLSFGGVKDKDVPKNQILFYKSFYGLRANDLGKFAPPEKAATYKRTGGEYFNAYFELIKELHPCTEVSRAISPHIDRWWHNVSMMPDLDDDNQTRQENEIYAALFWSLLNEYIVLNKANKNGKAVYTLFKEQLDIEDSESEDEKIIVSNGTPCDTLYEVWDALSIYPGLVAMVLAHNEKKISSNLEKKLKLSNCEFTRKLKNFKVDEYPLVIDGKNVARSVLELPLLIARSMNPDTFDAGRVVNLMKAEIAEIEKTVARFTTKAEYDEVVSQIIYDQLELMINHLKLEDAVSNYERIFSRITATVIKCLEEHGDDELVEKAEALFEEFK